MILDPDPWELSWSLRLDLDVCTRGFCRDSTADKVTI